MKLILKVRRDLQVGLDDADDGSGSDVGVGTEEEEARGREIVDVSDGYC